MIAQGGKLKTRRRRPTLWGALVLFLVIAGVVASTTHVPATVGQAIGGITGDEAPPDSDGDGLPDQVERAGWRTQVGLVYRTDAESRDSDGDGLTDGDEAGSLITTAEAGNVYSGYSHPGLADTDSDNLGDAGEADLGLDPFDPDSDGDRLADGREVEVVGSAPDLPDTDGDGFDDGYEDDHRNDQGLDPLWVDVKVSKKSYLADFAKGFGAGDAWREDSLAWLAGNLTSGAASSVPGLGSLAGAAADGRDAVASAIRADWVGAGYSALGAVPGGDAGAVPAKAARFVARNPHRAAAVGKFIATSPRVPAKIRVKTGSRIWKKWDALTRAGASQKALLALQKGATNLDNLGDALERQNHVEDDDPTQTFSGSREGEAFLASRYGGQADRVDRQVRMAVGGCDGGCNSRIRMVDVLVDGVAREAKVGHVAWSPSIEAQIWTDAWLMRNGAVEGAHWHFFASSYSNTLGADERVFSLLDAAGISYTVHLPA